MLNQLRLKSHKNSGFSLIELLVALTILSLGLISLAHLQSKMTTKVDYAAKQSNALALAQSKIDDLKHFETVETESGKVAYEDIGNNTGGVMAAGTTNTGFTLGWCVNTDDCLGETYEGNYYYSSTNASATTTNPGSKPYPDFKKIKVYVTWTNRNGETQMVANETLIPAISPSQSGVIANASTNLAPGP